jgi:phage terminase small subunit
VSTSEGRTAAPARLGVSGAAFWRQVVDLYVLSDAELRLLEQVCSTLDDLDDLAAVVAAEGRMAVGAKGQPVVHPAVQEARQQRVVLGRLLGQLALPDADGDVVRSPQQVRSMLGGQAKWRTQRRAAGF